jgi:Ca2+:H+ antiporter
MIESRNQQPRPVSGPARRLGHTRLLLQREWSLPVTLITTGLFLAFGTRWLADLSQPGWFALILAWLFAAMLVSAVAVVRHAESLAVKFGEPLGTLVLTLSVVGIEVMMIAAVMSAGRGNVALARDAMFAVIMIVLNGMVGLCLLLGGLRYYEQTYNLQGANAFLAVIVPLAVLGLVLPNYTVSSPGPTFSPLHSTFLILMSIGLYAVFLAIQTSRHRDYFVPHTADGQEAVEHNSHEVRSVTYHGPLLLAYLLPVGLLAKKIAVPIDYGVHVLSAPPALGGFLVSVLVLCPESVAAARSPGQPTPALRELVIGFSARQHQSDHTGCAYHWVPHGPNHRSRTQRREHGSATLDPGCHHLDLCERADQCPPGSCALVVVPCLFDADLRGVNGVL